LRFFYCFHYHDDFFYFSGNWLVDHFTSFYDLCSELGLFDHLFLQFGNGFFKGALECLQNVLFGSIWDFSPHDFLYDAVLVFRVHMAVLVIVLPYDPLASNFRFFPFQDSLRLNHVLFQATFSTPSDLTRLFTTTLTLLFFFNFFVFLLATGIHVDDLVEEGPIPGAVFVVPADLAHQRVAHFEVEGWVRENFVVLGP